MFLVIDIISAATFGILAISAIASTYLFYNSKNKEREKETFDYIDDKFNDFLQICLDKPYLDIFDTADEKKSELNETQKKEILSLRAQLRGDNGLDVRDNVYYTPDGDGPFCPNCYDKRKKLIRIRRVDTGSAPEHACRLCGSKFTG